MSQVSALHLSRNEETSLQDSRPTLARRKGQSFAPGRSSAVDGIHDDPDQAGREEDATGGDHSQRAVGSGIRRLDKGRTEADQDSATQGEP